MGKKERRLDMKRRETEEIFLNCYFNIKNTRAYLYLHSVGEKLKILGRQEMRNFSYTNMGKSN